MQKRRFMEKKARFLNKNEYVLTKDIFVEAFNDTLDEPFMDEFYGKVRENGECSGTINNNVIAAVEEDGRIVASAQYFIVRVASKDKKSAEFKVPYIMGVCTAEDSRHRGYMDQNLRLIIDRLKKEGYPWCFLLPVDTAIYRHLGFNVDWTLTDEELIYIYADGDGLYTASAKTLNADSIEAVDILGRAAD